MKEIIQRLDVVKVSILPKLIYIFHLVKMWTVFL